MLHVIRYAQSVFEQERIGWEGLMRAGMRENFSWNRPAREYEKLYDSLITK